jgi:ABC-2 type transport system ATP-binding protein
VIEISHLTKKFGDVTAVHDLTFSVQPGEVTGFLGPNGSGKTTTMRMILGLHRPTSGNATVNGKDYRDLAAPLTEVGALLDAKALHPGRTARHHLRALALSNGISPARVDEVLSIVGLSSVADKRAGEFSLGMSQRLGIAAAILGDPGVLMFDEPVNGLDPEGIRWVREFFRFLASEGRTVLVSSHLMSEMQLTADRFIIIGRGRLITQGTQDELSAHVRSTVRVVTANNDTLATLLAPRGWTVEREGDGLHVTGGSAREIGQLAFDNQLAIYELNPLNASLEEAFMELTAGEAQYTGKVQEA